MYSFFSLLIVYEYHIVKNKIFATINKNEHNSFVKLYPYQKDNYRFLFDAAIFNSKFYPNNIKTSIILLKRSRELYIHKTNTLVLAGYYLKDNQLRNAEEMYLFNYYNTANSFNSEYILASFYFKTKQKKKFNSVYFQLIRKNDIELENYKVFLNYMYKTINHE